MIDRARGFQETFVCDLRPRRRRNGQLYLVPSIYLYVPVFPLHTAPLWDWSQAVLWTRWSSPVDL